MSGMTNYLRAKTLDHTLGQIAYAIPTTVYLALFSADPTDEGLFTDELVGGSYARVDVTGKFGLAVAGLIKNNLEILFIVPTADWGIVTHCALVDESNNALYTNALTNAVEVFDGDDFKFKAYKLILTLESI